MANCIAASGQQKRIRQNHSAAFQVFIKNLQIYNEERRRFSLVRNQPRKIVEKVASDIEKLLAKKRNALNASIPVLFFYF